MIMRMVSLPAKISQPPWLKSIPTANLHDSLWVEVSRRAIRTSMGTTKIFVATTNPFVVTSLYGEITDPEAHRNGAGYPARPLGALTLHRTRSLRRPG